MKFLSILAAVSLALAPVIASAGSDGDSTDDGRPISGPVAGRALPVAAIPIGGAAVGGVALLGGAVLCILACGGSSNASNVDTNNGSN